MEVKELNLLGMRPTDQAVEVGVAQPAHEGLSEGSMAVAVAAPAIRVSYLTAVARRASSSFHIRRAPL